MKRFFLLLIAICLLIVQVMPAFAEPEITPYADAIVASGSVNLNTHGKGIFRITIYRAASEIKVISCTLEEKVGNNWVFAKSLEVPDVVAKNRNIYSATKDYSSSCKSGHTYRLTGTYDIDGYQKTYTSPARSF